VGILSNTDCISQSYRSLSSVQPSLSEKHFLIARLRANVDVNVTRTRIYAIFLVAFGLAYYPLRSDVGDRIFLIIAIVYAAVSRIIAARYGKTSTRLVEGVDFPEKSRDHNWLSRHRPPKSTAEAGMTPRSKQSRRLISVLVKLACFFAVVVAPPLLVDQPTRTSLGASPYQAAVALSALFLMWLDKRHG
jgi:hypothetical protein